MDTKNVGYVISYAEDQNNYGNSLQAYALLKKMQDLGYNVEIIRYIRQRTLFDKFYLIIKMIQCHDVKSKFLKLKRKIGINKPARIRAKNKIRSEYVNQFKETYLKPYFRICIGYNELKKCSLLYDSVIVGSDQVWSPLSLYSKFTNLIFVDDNVNKISYSSSFGVSKIPMIQIEETSSYLNRFNYIGTREVSGKEIVESLSSQKATIVADPTILMTNKEWVDFIDDIQIDINEPYIFCYFLGSNEMFREEVLKLQKKTNLKIVMIRHMDEFIKKDECFGDFAPYNVGPKEFLKYIQKADYVCTDSLHCTAFSLEFEKKFMTFYRYRNNSVHSRNTRIDSLLSIVNLKNRIYSDNIFEITKPIDYTIVNDKLSVFRDLSHKFLVDSLKNLKNNNN